LIVKRGLILSDAQYLLTGIHPPEDEDPEYNRQPDRYQPDQDAAKPVFLNTHVISYIITVENRTYFIPLQHRCAKDILIGCFTHPAVILFAGRDDPAIPCLLGIFSSNRRAVLIVIWLT